MEKHRRRYNWFNNLMLTSKTRFIKFDITNFYPTITKNTLINVIKFAEKFTPVSNNDHKLKTLLNYFYKNKTWKNIQF